MDKLFIIASLVIVAGYLNLLVRVPRALLLFTPPGTPKAVTWGLKIGGGLFFFTCALTHASQVIHVWNLDLVGRDLLYGTHIANVVVQGIAVWVFGVALPAFLTLIRESLASSVRVERRAEAES